MKIRKEFKEDMYILFMFIITGIFLYCVYYSWCMFLTETIGLPVLTSRLEEQGTFEILVSGGLYTAFMFISVMIVILIKKLIYTIYNYIFE